MIETKWRIKMRKIAKIIFAVGTLLTLVSIVGIVISGANLNMASPESEDWGGTLLWEGDTPSTIIEDFKWSAIYNVWVEIGSEDDIEIEIYNLDGTQEEANRFVSCSELNDCDIFDVDGKIDGFVYIGEIVVDNSGKYEISFTHSNGDNIDIQIREENIAGFFGILGGFVGCCVGIIVLLIGISIIFLKKDKKELIPKQVMIVGREERTEISDLTDLEQEKNNEWWKDDS
jgi:hypothetical protein